MGIVDPQRLLETLIAQPRETEWLEFKQNQFDHDSIGKYVSGLANSAMLHNEPNAYLVFGVEDDTHKVVGTGLRLKAETVGGEPLEHWLSKLLHPAILVEFISFEYNQLHIELLCIHPAYMSPVRFTPPLFQVVQDSLVVTIFAARSFAAMTKDDRIRACYQHASVRWEAGMAMSNQSLRDRFGLSQAQYPQVSLVISDAKDAGLIKPQDEGQANRVARYIPFWA